MSVPTVSSTLSYGVLFDGERLPQLFSPTEARELAQVLTSLAARAEDG
jgi:hypothetical protein